MRTRGTDKAGRSRSTSDNIYSAVCDNAPGDRIILQKKTV